MTTTRTYDTTRRSLATAKRMPQWQRLITAVHAAQDVAEFRGRQFGAKEMEHFGATLIGTPETKVGQTPTEFECYWVERQSTGTQSRYVLKRVLGYDLAKVDTIAQSRFTEATPEEDEARAVEFVKSAYEMVHPNWR